MNRPLPDISRGADDEAGKSFVPQAVLDQYTEDRKDEVYFSEETILEHASDTTESGQFILDVMTAYFDYLKASPSQTSRMDFSSIVIEHCQQLRNDTTDYVVRNA